MILDGGEKYCEKATGSMESAAERAAVLTLSLNGMLQMLA